MFSSANEGVFNYHGYEILNISNNLSYDVLQPMPMLLYIRYSIFQGFVPGTKIFVSNITKTSICKYVAKISFSKTEKNQIKNLRHFSCFWSKHRLWVLVRTASRGGSYEYPQSMVLSRNKKNNVYPCKPPVLLCKSGI